MVNSKYKVVIIIISTALIIGGCSLIMVIGKDNVTHDRQDIKPSTKVDSIGVGVFNKTRIRKRESKKPPKT